LYCLTTTWEKCKTQRLRYWCNH